MQNRSTHPDCHSAQSAEFFTRKGILFKKMVAVEGLEPPTLRI